MSARPITVGAMRRILATRDPSDLIVLATRDRKGQPTFLPVHSTSFQAYDVRHRDVGLFELSPAAVALGKTQEDCIPNGKPALVLSA